MQGVESIPTWLATAWNISLESAQVILSIAVIFAVLFPVMLLARGRGGMTLYLLTFFLTEALLIGIGWLPYWVMVGTIAVTAIAIALLGTRTVTVG